MSYYFSKVLNIVFDDAIAKVMTSLQEEGFGILTEIDVQATLKKNLNAEIPRYKILGACHPASAYQALQVEDKIGTMLPCNVIVQEKTDGVEVSAVDPIASMQAVANPALKAVAEQVRVKLKSLIEHLT
jgi:uncharacterized protein (DUF302 family)